MNDMDLAHTTLPWKAWTKNIEILDDNGEARQVVVLEGKRNKWGQSFPIAYVFSEADALFILDAVAQHIEIGNGGDR